MRHVLALACTSAALVVYGQGRAAVSEKEMPHATHVRQLSPDISGVYSGGAWKDSERHGHYRVVLIRKGWEHTPSAIHVQWMWQRESEQAIEVLISRPVEDVNEAGAWSFGRAQFHTLDDGRVEVTLPATNIYTLTASTLRLRLDGDGYYTLVQRPE